MLIIINDRLPVAPVYYRRVSLRPPTLTGSSNTAYAPHPPTLPRLPIQMRLDTGTGQVRARTGKLFTHARHGTTWHGTARGRAEQEGKGEGSSELRALEVGGCAQPECTARRAPGKKRRLFIQVCHLAVAERSFAFGERARSLHALIRDVQRREGG